MAEGGEVLRDGTGQMLDGANQPGPGPQTAQPPTVTPVALQTAAEAEAEARGEARDGTFAAGAPAPPNVTPSGLTVSFTE